jgi:hypothetical protein
MSSNCALRTMTALIVAFGTLAAAGAFPGPAPRQEPGPSSPDVQQVSWDGWLEAKANAEKRDAEGDYVGALQYYLEYIRQAEGLDSPPRVAWGKNNAAYMIIKMYRQDHTVDLTPAKKLLEEGLAVEGATEDCRQIMAKNLEYVKSALRTMH